MHDVNINNFEASWAENGDVLIQRDCLKIINMKQNVKYYYNHYKKWILTYGIYDHYSKGYAVSTVKSHVAALSFFLKIQNHPDSTDNFIIRKLIQGFSRLSPTLDMRLPITLELVSKIIKNLPQICFSTFEAYLFQSAFLIAFLGFLE